MPHWAREAAMVIALVLAMAVAVVVFLAVVLLLSPASVSGPGF